MSKLWQLNNTTNSLVEKFTVGDDPIVDGIFLPYDIIASRAHAKMLTIIGILSEQEYRIIEGGLQEIQELWEKGEFTISLSDEDCHTAIESYLTSHYGEVGKKIHTGRSRNDQSLTMIRLYLRDIHKNACEKLEKLISTLADRCHDAPISMPGYTHWQKAMPTTTITWLGSFHDAIKDQYALIESIGSLLDQSPLGSAAGFGIENFPNNRDFTAKEMGFAKVEENPMYCGLSRGLFEHSFLGVLGNILMILSRFNNDVLLFTTSEFGFLSLPDSMTTGSSIMPQKRNYDLSELVRAKISLFFGYADQMRNMYTHLMSGYQRDLQMTKSILLNAYTTWENIIDIVTLIGENLLFHEKKLTEAMTPDIYATNEVYKRIEERKIPFRDAYREVKTEFFEKSI